MKLIIYINNTGKELAELLCQELDGFRIITLDEFGESEFRASEAVVFIGSAGICVRRIAGWLEGEYRDPGEDPSEASCAGRWPVSREDMPP